MNLDDVGVIFSRLVSQVPARKALVVTVSGVRFVDERLVEVDLFPSGSSPPVEAAVVGSEVQFEAIFVRQGEEHFADILVSGQKRRNHLRRIDALILVARPNDDQRVEANAFVKLKLAPPLPLRPVLTGNIVSYLVEKSTRDPGERRHARIVPT